MQKYADAAFGYNYFDGGNESIDKPHRFNWLFFLCYVCIAKIFKEGSL